MLGERNCLCFETAAGGYETPPPRLTVLRATALPPRLSRGPKIQLPVCTFYTTTTQQAEVTQLHIATRGPFHQILLVRFKMQGT